MSLFFGHIDEMNSYDRLNWYSAFNKPLIAVLCVVFLYAYLAFAHKFEMKNVLFWFFVVFILVILLLYYRRGLHKGPRNAWKQKVSRNLNRVFWSGVILYACLEALSRMAPSVDVESVVDVRYVLYFFVGFYLVFFTFLKSYVLLRLFGRSFNSDPGVNSTRKRNFLNQVIAYELASYVLCLLVFLLLMPVEPRYIAQFSLYEVLKLMPQGFILHLIPFLCFEFKCYAIDHLRSPRRKKNVFEKYFQPLTLTAALASFIIIALFEALPILIKIVIRG